MKLHLNKSQRKKIGVVVAVSLVLIFYYGYRNKFYPSTDDAYVQANVAQMAAQVSGPVSQVFVQNYQTVKQGQVLFVIDPRPFQLALAKAQANYQWNYQQVAAAQAAVQTAQAVLAQHLAELDTTQKNTRRILTLVKEGQLPKANGDDAQGQLAVAQAAVQAASGQLQQARQQLGQLGSKNTQVQIAWAELEQAKLNLDYTRIVAPNAGTLINFNLRPGTLITAQTPLFSLIEQTPWWVDANFKETDLARIRPGQKVSISIDTFPSHTYHGTVESISRGSGAAFSLFPPENATGNWVKVTQRFPVRIVLSNSDPHFPLRLGASCDVTVNTTSL